MSYPISSSCDGDALYAEAGQSCAENGEGGGFRYYRLSPRVAWRTAGPPQHSPYDSVMVWGALHGPVLAVGEVGPGALIMRPFTLPSSCTPSSCVTTTVFIGVICIRRNEAWGGLV